MDIGSENIQDKDLSSYHVHPMMKRIWAVQLDILKEIDRICKRHHINYYGWFGTLLGAVRHHGFIPWDDDLDLAMLREDHDRFLYHAETELPKEWQISKSAPSSLCILNTDRIRTDQAFLDRSHGCPYITGVDIFCLDRIPQNREEAGLQLELFGATHGLCLNWSRPDTDEQWGETGKWDYLKEIEQLTGYRFDLQLPIKEQLYLLGDRLAAMYQDTEADEVTNMHWMYDHRHYRIPLSCFDKSIEVPFEDTTVPILEDHDLICRLTYGDDYMTPVKQCEHDYLKKQVEALRRAFKKRGEALPNILDITFT